MSGFDINQLTISGNLTADPELRSTSGGTSLCKIRIAHNERYKNGAGEWTDRPQYFDVTVWGGIGDWVGGHLNKGDKVVVAGRLKWREWETEGGSKRQAVDITADSVVPAPRGDSNGAGDGFTPRDDDDDIQF
jgi:single-strand DNA-binding protein